MEKRLEPFEAAHMFIFKNYPKCQGALLAGSVVRGEATQTSDLDIVVFDNNVRASYRESLKEYGWPIEVFVHNLSSYKSFFESDSKRARPSLPRMVAEGIVVKDDGIIEVIKKVAEELLEQGPELWPEETIKLKQYFITDALDDLIGCNNRFEGLFIAGKLAELISEFVLRTNQQWIGESKWIMRTLKQYNLRFAKDFGEAFDSYYKTSDKIQVERLVDQVLEPYGGRLFAGFSIGKGTKHDNN